MQRSYRVFRTLGLRHLLVVNKRNQVLGIVTRSDLVSTQYLDSSGSSTAAADAEKRRSRKKQQSRYNMSPTIDIDISLADICDEDEGVNVWQDMCK